MRNLIQFFHSILKINFTIIRVLMFGIAFFFASSIALTAQSNFTLSGYVKDASTGEYLPGANVFIKELLKGTSTNSYGFYSITLPKGNYTLGVSFMGYSEYSSAVNLNKDQRINITISPKAIESKEFEVTEKRIENNVKSTDMGRVELSVENMKKLPVPTVYM